MADAKQKRNEQLKRWLGSETDQEPPVLKKKKTKVKFDDGAVFLAACSSGDTEEVLRMLDRGADINYANVDGLTALHQVRVRPLVTPVLNVSPPAASTDTSSALPWNTCQMDAIPIPLFTYRAQAPILFRRNDRDQHTGLSLYLLMKYLHSKLSQLCLQFSEPHPR